MSHTVEHHNLLDNSTAETVLLPNLPHKIEMRRALIPDFRKVAPSVFQLLIKQKEAEKLSYGLIINSFYELEPGYVDYFRNVVGRKAWHVGPLLLNDKNVNTFDRGSKSAIDEASCLSWLGKKSAGSVLYVCFGSASFFTTRQLREIAVGLEGSGHAFIWVVRDDGDEQWMPEGCEERIEGRGLIIKGWAPQMMILNHEAVGGYLTHCGWNSSLEGICVGLPFVTWPLFAEQPYNERLIVDVLKVGVAVGVKEYSFDPEERTVIEAGSIETAVKKLMGDDEEAEERRRRAKELAAMARKAVEEGGSSYELMSDLIRELEGLRDRRNK